MRKFEKKNEQAGVAAGGVQMAERSGAKKNVKAAGCFEISKNIAGGGCCYGVTGGAKAVFGMLGVLFLSGVSENALAQCVATTDCATLGYTESSCPDGGVKCPFGNGYYCGGLTKEKCADLGFQYSCTGANDGGGAGEDCAGKYAECTCSSGYKWKDGKCQLSTIDCEIGSILYSDETCSSSVIDGKTPIGVVVYLDGKGHGQAATTLGLGEDFLLWSQIREDISTLKNYIDENEAIKDFDSCGNTQKAIAEQGSDSTLFPEIEGREWCIPAAGILNSIKENLSKVNSSLLAIGVSAIQYYSPAIGNAYYSSTEYNSSEVWGLYFSYNGTGRGTFTHWPKGGRSSYGSKHIYVTEF